MSVFLTIGSVADVPVLEFEEHEPIRIGDRGRTFDGSWRGMERAEKRSWSGVLDEMTHTQVEALRAAVALGARVTCSGAALGASSVVCIVTVTGGTYVHDGTGFLKMPSIHLMEA
jgi:hypothetical protein